LKQEFVQITDELFLKLGKLITERYGIKMSPEKKIMFQARLQRRLQDLNIDSFDEYASRLLSNSPDTDELKVIADYISTNKTEFFRESEHFQFITSKVIPEFLNPGKELQSKRLKIWSAGCSNGQEAYTLGITIEEYMRNNKTRFDYSILATDISNRMLEMAKMAVYPMSHVIDIPVDIKHRYFLKSKIIQDPKVRVVKDIRNRVRVAYLNLMDSSYTLEHKYDIIFLRNTLIYFERNIQLKVLMNIVDNLNTGGYLFVGHSESLVNLNLPLRAIAPSVYLKINK
jgi:chemotaxis protein methyltransferase CheR